MITIQLTNKQSIAVSGLNEKSEKILCSKLTKESWTESDVHLFRLNGIKHLKKELIKSISVH